MERIVEGLKLAARATKLDAGWSEWEESTVSSWNWQQRQKNWMQDAPNGGTDWKESPLMS
jgi:hypothetical protein